jgi:hypothetical protein
LGVRQRGRILRVDERLQIGPCRDANRFYSFGGVRTKEALARWNNRPDPDMRTTMRRCRCWAGSAIVVDSGQVNPEETEPKQISTWTFRASAAQCHVAHHRQLLASPRALAQGQLSLSFEFSPLCSLVIWAPMYTHSQLSLIPANSAVPALCEWNLSRNGQAIRSHRFVLVLFLPASRVNDLW